jgi:peptide/nickel transport system substrate-binding protein
VTAPVRVIGTTQLAGGAGTAYVQAALQAAGFKTTLTNRDTTTWADMLYSGKGDWDLTVMVVQNIARTVAVPASLLSGSPPPAGTNLAAIDDPDFTAALRTAASTLGTRSCDALKEAQRALVKSIDILPLATLPLQVATAPGVRVQAPSGLIELGSIRTA